MYYYGITYQSTSHCQSFPLFFSFLLTLLPPWCCSNQRTTGYNATDSTECTRKVVNNRFPSRDLHSRCQSWSQGVGADPRGRALQEAANFLYRPPHSLTAPCPKKILQLLWRILSGELHQYSRRNCQYRTRYLIIRIIATMVRLKMIKERKLYRLKIVFKTCELWYKLNTPKKVCGTLLYWEINSDKFKQQASKHVIFQGVKIEYKINKPCNSANYLK
jgi:hypothetical protein